MENLEVMVVLFIIVILGYVACKLGYMGDKFDKKLSSIVVDITCPLLVLSSVMGDELPDRTLILPLLGVGFLTYILLLVFGFGVPRLISKNHDDQGMIGFALMFANVGFIGYPIRFEHLRPPGHLLRCPAQHAEHVFHLHGWRDAHQGRIQREAV